MRLFPKAEFVLEIPAPVEVVRGRLASNVVTSFAFGRPRLFAGQVDGDTFIISTMERCRLEGTFQSSQAGCSVRVAVCLEDWKSWLTPLIILGYGVLAGDLVLGGLGQNPSRSLQILIVIAGIGWCFQPVGALVSARSRFNSARAQLGHVLRGDPLFT